MTVSGQKRKTVPAESKGFTLIEMLIVIAIISAMQ